MKKKPGEKFMEEQKNRKDTAAGQEKAGDKPLKKPAADGSD